MTRENKVWHVLGLISDLDATSLYPSAQDELGGYLKGKPKFLKTTDYKVLKTYDGYFVQIRITKVNKHRKLPLVSKKVDGIRMFSNDMEGEIVHMLVRLVSRMRLSFKGLSLRSSRVTTTTKDAILRSNE